MSGLRFQPSPSCHLSPQMISGQWKLLFVLFEFNFAPLTIPLFQAIALLLLSHLGLSFLDWNLILVENLHVSCFFSDYTHAAVSPHKLGIRTRQVSAQIWAKVSKTFSRRTFFYSPIAWNVTVACVGDRAVGFLRQRHECDVGWGVGQENLGERTWQTNIFDRCLFLAPVPCIMARYHRQKEYAAF